jgi:bifunctional lysine-specific demethylase and histidyl-hydroxylase NO66
LDALALLSGDARTFVEKVWSRRIHVHHSGASDLIGLLSVDDVDHLLTSSALRTPALRMVQDGSVLPSTRYTRAARLGGVALTGLIDPREVLALFDGGASLVLQGVHRYWPPLTEMVRDLELSLGHACQANAYLTPPGSQGFALHSDTHDVFVVQTYGVKNWEVHDGHGVNRIRMEPGVSLYLPTGTPHAARTEADASLHVTIGINRTTWRTILERRVQRLLADSGFDEPLPAGYPRDPDGLAAGLAVQVNRLRDLLDDTDVGAWAESEIDRFATSRGPALRGGLVDRLNVAALRDASWVRRRAGSVCELRPDRDRLRVLLGDREMRVPAWLAEPLEAIRGSDRLRPADLAEWLDEASRLVLVRRLVREGLLEVER